MNKIIISSEKWNRLIAAQNNAIRTNYIKVKIDNNKCMLCRDRDEKVNHINKCRKLAQKEYKCRYDWLGMVIHRELYNRVRFHHTDKWYMHKPEHVLNEKENHLNTWILWNLKVSVIPIITGALGTIPKNQENKL